MYTTTTYLFWFSLVVFVLYSIISNYWFGVAKEGLTTGSDDDYAGISGSKLINFDSTYKIISTERQDNSSKYADVPDKGQAIQFIKKKDYIYIINPITQKSFYINNNHITMKVKSIKTNSFPEGSLVATVSAKCKHCQVTTEWKLFFSEISNDSKNGDYKKKDKV
jgi:hypothetical protein